MDTWPPHKFDRYAEYHAALLALVQNAQRTLVFYEQDYSNTGLDSRAAYDALNAFFMRNPASEVRFLAQDPAYIASHCPLLLQLRETRSHQFSMRLMPANSLALPWPFGLADMQRIVRRNHFDWAKGETSDDARQCTLALQAFENAWETATFDSAWQRLSL